MKSLSMVLVVALALPLAAQTSGYAEMKERDIKALPADEVSGLLEGKGMGLALPAELNGYPGPKHVLEMAAELKLTELQHRSISDIEKKMHRSAVALGGKIVQAERHLDAAFSQQTIDPVLLANLTSGIAKLRGELRYAHLEAHLATRGVLTPEQTVAYQRLRGYASVRHHSGH